MWKRSRLWNNQGKLQQAATAEISLPRRLWTIFSAMLVISAFTFGGGFVIVSLMKKKFVDELHWLSEEEMLDMTALAQSAPGAIAVNGAILVGRRIAGWPGMAGRCWQRLFRPSASSASFR